MCFPTVGTPSGPTYFTASTGSTGILWLDAEFPPKDIATLSGGSLNFDEVEGPNCTDGTVTWEKVVVTAARTSTGVDRLILRATYSSGLTIKWLVQHTSDGGVTWVDSTDILTSGTEAPYSTYSDPPIAFIDKCHRAFTSYTDNLTGTTHTLSPTNPFLPYITLPTGCCKDPDTGRCRCLPGDCATGECNTCFGVGASSFGFEFECCMDYRSEIDATMAGFSFDISTITDGPTKTSVASILTALGLSNGGSGDIFTGTITKHAVYASGAITWSTCGDATETLTGDLTTDGWHFGFTPYQWINTIYVKNAGEPFLNIVGIHDPDVHAEENHFTCCGGNDTRGYTLHVGSTSITSTAVTFDVAIKKNACCNCRGSNRPEGIGYGSYRICGPTSDGSNAVCEGDPTGDDNTCTDAELGVDSTKKNICSSTQDEDCLPVCQRGAGVPDTITITIGGVTIPLTWNATDRAWEWSCCDGYDSSACIYNVTFNWTIHYDAYDEEVLQYNFETEEYEWVTIHHPAEDVSATDTKQVAGVVIYLAPCGPCIDGNPCFSGGLSVFNGGCGQVNPTTCYVAFRMQTPSCDDPRGTWCVSDDIAHSCYTSPGIPDDCSVTATVS